MIDCLYQLFRPLVFRLEPETAHKLAIAALKYLPRFAILDDSARLSVNLFGRHFSNPIGLAAGFDKQCEATHALLALGFGFVELGGVVPLPQPGNPRPRVFRLPSDEAMINRFGLNSDGLEIICQRLRKRNTNKGVVGINIGANKDSIDRTTDFITCIAALNDLSDFLTINVSSPNTPGLRDLQGEQYLDDLLARSFDIREKTDERRGDRESRARKMAPDRKLDSLDAIVETALRRRVDAIAISNTTVARPATLHDQSVAKEAGGLSGKPLFSVSTRLLAETYSRVGTRIPLIGVGGVDSGETAWKKILAGATLVQLYTALIYKGPGLIKNIKNDLVARIPDGKTISEFIGTHASLIINEK